MHNFQDIEMLWFVDDFKNRRLNKEIVACTKIALEDALRRIPSDAEIDADKVFDMSLSIGTAWATRFVKEGLI